MPAYNAADTIAEAVHSALCQRDVQVEVIVIDDGSEDDTCEELEQFSNQIKLIKQSHLGRSVARNIGLQEATTTFVAFLDADDIWVDTKLQVQLLHLTQHPQAVLTYSRAALMDPNGAPVTPTTQVGGGRPGVRDIGDELLNGNMIPLLTVMARTEAIKRAGGFDPDIDYAEDWDLWLRLAQLGPFHFSDACLAYYRTPGVSRWARIESSEEMVKRCISIIARYGEGIRAKRASVHIYAKAAMYATFLENQELAKKYLQKASSLDPEIARSVLLDNVSDMRRFLPKGKWRQLQREINRMLPDAT